MCHVILFPRQNNVQQVSLQPDFAALGLAAGHDYHGVSSIYEPCSLRDPSLALGRHQPAGREDENSELLTILGGNHTVACSMKLVDYVCRYKCGFSIRRDAQRDVLIKVDKLLRESFIQQHVSIRLGCCMIKNAKWYAQR